jgi:hypothetical protein
MRENRSKSLKKHKKHTKRVMHRRNKKQTKNKRNTTHKKSKKKVMKGGNKFVASWVGVPNKNDPTGFGWLNKSFLKPCNY